MIVDVLLLSILLLGILLLGSNRLGTIIQIFALQSLITSSIPFIAEWQHPTVHVLLVTTGAFAIKVFLVPYFLFWAIRHVHIRREDAPIIGYGSTMLAGGVLAGALFLLTSKLRLPAENISDFLIPTAFTVMVMGLLLLVSRTKAITQVIGYLVMENGVFLFSVPLMKRTPILVEMGILLDVFVAVFIFSIVVNHMNEEREDSSTLRMTTLKDF